MTKLKPISRKELIDNLRDKGFTGPFRGGKHEFMIRGTIRLSILNVHRSEISSDLLSRILRQAGIARDDWK